MKRVFARVDATHRKLIDAITPIDDESFRRRPSPNEWSIAEIVHHLCLVEQRVLEELERGLSGPAVRVRLLQRVMPIRWLVGSRVRRVKAPKTVEPLNSPSKEEVIANYESVRRSLKEFSTTHGRAGLKKLPLKHPFLGTFDGVSAVAFVGHHELRHFKQIKETIKKIGG